jgi:DNA-directed RNA polymerase specialized sigma24 family protein
MTEGQSQSWSQLMAAAQSGDSCAYARLLHEILPDVRLIVLRHRHAPDRVEMVVRDVLRTLHQLRHTYDPARPFADWLAAIAERRALAAAGRKAG